MEKNVQVLGIKASLRKKGEGPHKSWLDWQMLGSLCSILILLLGELHEMIDVKCLYLPGNMGLINAS